MVDVDPVIESQALDETEKAMRDLVQVGFNIGLSKMALAMMLRSIADDIEPKVLN